MSEDRWSHVIRHIQDAVVEFELIDDEPVIRRVNRAFEEVFGYDREDVADRSLNHVIVPEWSMDEARELDDRTASGKVNYERVRRQTADGLRDFLYRGIPFEGSTARIDGFAVYTDLTEASRRERQLQVLNRILRHNLRNRATVICGHAARLRETVDDPAGETADVLRTIEGAAADLEHLASEASTIRRVLEADDCDDEHVDCSRLVRRLLPEYRERFPEATIESELSERRPVAADSLLSVAVENLLENAIVHNDADEPTVLVRADPGDNWVDLAIEDDGPPIPASERAVVTGERPITQTEHGQGLGLWLATWTVEQFGGELLFEDSDLGGNSVRLRLPQPG